MGTPFDKYVFIEKHPELCKQLNNNKYDFPDLVDRISICNDDANEKLLSLCRLTNWKNTRAVVFLDPYAMQVEWSTIQVIANTRSIDMWYLFPLMAVNRLLKNNGKIKQEHKLILDKVFGTEEWFKVFYQTSPQINLFGNEETYLEKVKIDNVGSYVITRLKEVFPKVVENPLPLNNSRNSPLFLLCFAASNPLGIKIANDVIRSLAK